MKWKLSAFIYRIFIENCLFFSNSLPVGDQRKRSECTVTPYWLAVFWSTNNSPVLASEGEVAKFLEILGKTQYLMNTLYLKVFTCFVSCYIGSSFSHTFIVVCIFISFVFEYVYKQRFGSISFWRGSGSGSWDTHLGKVDPDPRIQLSIIVDPDPRIHIWKKWIRIQIWIRVLWIFFDYDYFSSSLK